METVQAKAGKRIGIRQLVKLAEEHAAGILESTDDSAFWGEEFWDEHEAECDREMTRARKIIQNRIMRKQ